MINAVYLSIGKVACLQSAMLMVIVGGDHTGNGDASRHEKRGQLHAIWSRNDAQVAMAKRGGGDAGRERKSSGGREKSKVRASTARALS